MTRPTRPALALAILTLIYVFNFMDRQILGVLAEPIKHELNLSDKQLGLLTGFMFAIFYTTLGIPLAWLADRTRRTWVIAASCTAWSVFSAACGLATGFATMAAARIGVAVGEAGGVPPSYSLIADLFPTAQRARAVAIYSLGVPVGIGIGTAAGGWIAAAHGWRVAFFAVSAPGVLLALALLVLVRDPARGHSEVGEQALHAPISLPRAVALFAGSPSLLLVSVAGGLGAFTCYGLMAWISAYLIRVLGMTLAEIGSYLSITLALGLGAGIWVSGVLTDRFAPRDRRMYVIIPAVALALGAPSLLAATMLDDWRLALPVFGVTLALSVFYLAPTVAVVQQLVPPAQRSTASAMMLLCLNLIGLGCGPFFLGAVSDAALPLHGTGSLRVAFQALVPMFAVAALAYLLAARTLGRAGTAAAPAISTS